MDKFNLIKIETIMNNTILKPTRTGPLGTKKIPIPNSSKQSFGLDDNIDFSKEKNKLLQESEQLINSMGDQNKRRK